MAEAYSVVLYRPGPRWDRSKPLADQEAIGEHFEFMGGLLSNGQAERAGPFRRGSEHLEGDLVGLVILPLSVAEAEELTAEDPAVVAGLMAPDVLPWYP